MNNKIREIAQKNKKEKWLKRILALLCVGVMLITMNSLKLTANTLARKPMCGLKEHTHKQKCYDGDGNLICGKIEHQHTDACYQEAPVTIEGVEIENPDLVKPDDVLDMDGSLDLDLDQSLDALPNLVSNDIPQGENPAENIPEYRLGEEARLSEIIENTGIQIDMAAITEVGVVDNDGSRAGWIESQKVDGDYIIRALRDFDEVELALVQTNVVVSVRLTDGRGPVEVNLETEKETEVGNEQPPVEGDGLGEQPVVLDGGDAKSEGEEGTGNREQGTGMAGEDVSGVDDNTEGAQGVDLTAVPEQPGDDMQGEGQGVDLTAVPEQPKDDTQGEGQGVDLEDVFKQPVDDDDNDETSDGDEGEKETTSSVSPDGEPAERFATPPVAPEGEALGSDETSSPTEGDGVDEASTDQKPSPATEGSDSGEGGTSQSDVTDEVGSSDETSDGDEGEKETTSSVSPDGEPASPEGEALGSDETSSPTEGDTTDEVNPDEAESVEGDVAGEVTDDGAEDEGTSSGADAPPSPEGKAFGEQPAEGDAAGEVNPDEAEPVEGDGAGETTDDGAEDEGTSSGADAPPSPEGKAFGEQPAEDDAAADETNPDEAQPAEGDAAEGDAAEGDAAGEGNSEDNSVAHIDLSGVEDYPLSLRGLMARANVTAAAAAESASTEAETAPEGEDIQTDGQAEVEAPAQAEELPASDWVIEYDEAVFAVAPEGDDYTVMPLVSFDTATITVNGASLVLENCRLPEDAAAQPEEEAEAVYPAQHFEESTPGMNVVVDAPEGAFPEGTTMVVRDVEDEQTLTNIEDTVSEDFVEVTRVHAVDISFWHEGVEIEPRVPISVKMSVPEVKDEEEAVVVHVDDAGETEVVDSQGEAQNGATGVAVEMPANEQNDAPAEGTETQSFEADSFSVYAVVVAKTIETKYIDASGEAWNITVGYGKEANIPADATLRVSEVTSEAYLAQASEALESGKRITEAYFFDIAILDADGNEIQPDAPVQVNITLDEGAEAVSEAEEQFKQDAGDPAVCAVHFGEENTDVVQARETDDAVVFDAASFSVWGVVYTVDFHYTANGETFDYSIPGGDCASLRELLPALGIVADDPETEANELDGFMAAVTDVTFSAPELIEVAKVEENTAVGALRAAVGMESEYSAALTEAEREAIDARELTAPDWALFSLKPFTSNEALTVVMDNGDSFALDVTDAQIATRVMTADGITYAITLTFGPEAEIPLGAELRAREVIPGTVEYDACLYGAKQAIGAREETAGEQPAEPSDADGEEPQETPEAASGESQVSYARFFDIEIWGKYEEEEEPHKIEPAAPVSVNIELADAPEEELKVVHFDEVNGPVVMESETADADGEQKASVTDIRFVTDSFSVYGVITVADAPSGVTDLGGKTATISRNGKYMTSEVITVTGSENYNNVQRIKKSDNANNAAQWHFDAVNANNGEYYIWTYVGGQKKYLSIERLTNGWEENADVVLSDSPQKLKVEDKGGFYNISNADVISVTTASGTKFQTYYVNEHYGDNGDAFAAYTGLSEAGNAEGSRLTLAFNPVTKNTEQYMLITKVGNDYYVVLNDGRLEKAESVQVDESGNIVAGNFTTPMTWTWDGSHLFHNSLAVGYTDDQRASDYYRRYIDPKSDNGLTQERGERDTDHTHLDTTITGSTDSEGNRVVYVAVHLVSGDDNSKYAERKVSDRVFAMQDTSFSTSGPNKFKITDDGQYLGVKENADGSLVLEGKKTEGSAAEFWFADASALSGASYVTLEVVEKPIDGEQYYVVVRDHTDSFSWGTFHYYRLVYPDRSLSDVSIANYEKYAIFNTPDQMQLWTYSGDEWGSQVTCSYNGQTYYLNPYDGTAITPYEAIEGSNNQLKTEGDGQLRGYTSKYFKINNNQLCGNVSEESDSGKKEVYLARLVSGGDMQYTDGTLAERYHMVNHIDISIEGLTELKVPLAYGTYQYKVGNSWQSFTVSNATNLTLTQKVGITEDDIKEGTITAYVKDSSGSAIYKDNLFTITGYSANEKTDYSTDQVRIEGNFKVADLPRYDEADSAQTRADRLANKVYYTVSVTKPVTFMFIDKDRGQIYEIDEDGNPQPMSITVDMTFSASFNYWDWNGEKANHNNECPPLQPSSIPSINGNDCGAYVRFYLESGNQFVKWQGAPNNSEGYLTTPDGKVIYHKKNSNSNNASFPEYCNESACGEHPEDWEPVVVPENRRTAGGIAGYGNSGMDFVLGGDAGKANSNIVALNITKKVVDEQGNIINLKTPMTNVFDVYYYQDGEENVVAGYTGSPTWNDLTQSVQVSHSDTSGFYPSGYSYQHSKKIKIGSAGMGLIYDYSVSPGMIYIEESQEEKDLPDEIVDTKDRKWEYVKTIIETEYVWRNSSNVDDMRHVTADYTRDGTPYRSIPEVLGEYHRPDPSNPSSNTNLDDENKPLRNGFVMFFVYNVYRPKPINVQVEKKWEYQNDDDELTPPSDASITVTMGRYKLENIPGYNYNGQLTITDSYTGIDSGYDAKYFITFPDGTTVEKNYQTDYGAQGITLTGLKAGQYVVSKVVPGKDDYIIENDEETLFVNVAQNGGHGTANFSTSKYTNIASNPNDWVKVGFRVSYPFGEGRTDQDAISNINMVYPVRKNSTVKFTYHGFTAVNPQNQGTYDASVGYMVYDWRTTDNESVLHWEPRSYTAENCPEGSFVQVNVGENDTCIMLLFGDENFAPAMGITYGGMVDNALAGNATNGMSASKMARSLSAQQGNTQQKPASPIEGMEYNDDVVRDPSTHQPILDVNNEKQPWRRQIVLNNGNDWHDWIKESSVVEDLAEYDENGNKYIYYVVNVQEQNVPATTQIVFDRSYTTSYDKTQNVYTYTFNVTNKMPDKTSITIKKVDDQNNAITLNAKFRLEKYTGAGTNDGYETAVSEIVVNGTSGSIEVSRGHYRLVETQTPEGYESPSAYPEFDVAPNATNGEIEVTYKQALLTDNEITVGNTPKGSLRLVKSIGAGSLAAFTGNSQEFTFTVELRSTKSLSGMKLNGQNIPANSISTNSGVTTITVPVTVTIDPDTHAVTSNSATISNIPVGTTYVVTEASHPGWQQVGDVNVSGNHTIDAGETETATITNRAVVDIEATKTWTNNGTGVTAQLKSASVTFTLQARSKTGENTWSAWAIANVTEADNGHDAQVELKTTGTASSDLSAWKVSWINLPKYDSQDCLIQYQVVESAAKVGTDNIQLPEQASEIAETYGTASGHDNPTAQVGLTNPLPTTEVTVKKTWSQTTSWPDAHIQVGMTLNADGREATGLPGYTMIVPDGSGEDQTISVPSQESCVWLTSADATDGHTWRNLPVYTAEGEKIEYTVVETGMRYKPDSGNAIDITDWASVFTTQTGALDNGTVTIDNTPETTEIDVTKVWLKNNAPREDKTSIAFDVYRVVPDGTDVKLDSVYTSVGDGTPVSTTAPTVGFVNGAWQTVKVSKLPKYELVVDGSTVSFGLINYYVVETGTTGDTSVTYQLGSTAKDTAEEAATNNGTITICNHDADVDINVLKVDATDSSKKLPAAEFQIKKYLVVDSTADYRAYNYHDNIIATNEAESKATTGTSGDELGKLAFQHLTAGKYMLIETQTPDGYGKVDNNDIYFTITPDGAVQWTDADGNEFSQQNNNESSKPNQVEYAPATATATFTVGNTPGVRLPATGGSGTTLYYIAGSALLILALALLLRRRRDEM